MINRLLATDIITAALATGGRFAEIFIEKNKKSSVALTNGKVERAMTGIDFGLGLRIFHEDRVIYSYTNDLSRERLMRLAKEAAAAIIYPELKDCGTLVFRNLNYENLNPVKIMPDTIEKKDTVDMLKSASDAAFGYDSLITQTMMSQSYSIQNITVINSEGVWAEDTRVRTRASISAVASDENEKQTGYFGPGALKGYEFYDDIELDEYA